MAIANPRIHIICGICGNKDSMKFIIKRDDLIENEERHDTALITCTNCSSVTRLDEIIEIEKSKKKE